MAKTVFVRKTRVGDKELRERLDPFGKPVEGEGEKKAEEPKPQEPQTDKRTVEQLKVALDGKQVEYPADARKDDLLKLATENGV